MMKFRLICLAAVLLLVLVGCGHRSSQDEEMDSSSVDIQDESVPETETIDPLQEETKISADEPVSATESAKHSDAGSSTVGETTTAQPSSASASPAVSAEPAAARALPDSEQTESEADASAAGATDVAANNTAIEQELLRLINAERQKGDIESLGMEEAMHFASRIRAQEATQSLSHTRPDGTAYYTAFDEAGFVYVGKWHGENVAMIIVSDGAYDQNTVAAALFAEWSKSSGHHQNMVNANFLQTGIGVYIQQLDGEVHIGAAQLFAGL